MHITSTTSEPADPRYAGRATRFIVTHYLLSYLGYYGLLSTLAVALSAASFNAGQIATLVMVFALTNKIANIPLAPWLDRMPTALAVLVGCVMAGAGFVSLRFATGMPMTVLSLGFAGVGISINALALKQLAAAASDRIENRSRLFALVSISINIAAAVAAPLALFFVDRGHHGDVLLAVAALYCLAGLVTFANRAAVPMGERATRAWSIGVYLAVLREPGLRAFFAINTFYWFMYGQLFNVLALYVTDTLNAPGVLGPLYTVNALMVVVLQLGVTRLTGRWTKGRQLNAVMLANVVFVFAFLSAFLLPGISSAIVFVVLFTTAEMIYMPSGDVLIVGLIRQQNRAVGYSIFAISTALGEALGGGAGVAAYRWLADHGHGQQFWLAAAILAVAFYAITQWLRRTAAGQHIE
ncbi:MFS transporter [Nocardia sp. NBC_01499]|uniref:MFS transporter n=1 Tax=Nocardia sp. NBC_01499 TaxID=2903597 RepID=UPI0038632FD8